MPQETMTLSALIVQLHVLQAQYGDVQVWIDDADTGWALEIDSIAAHDRGESKENGPSVYIAGSYSPHKPR